jgi:hypothetical protein
LNTRLISTLFGFVLVATNWYWSRSVILPNNSTTTVTLDVAGIASLFCSIALLILTVRLVRLLRWLLDHRIRVAWHEKLYSWQPCIALLPLLFRASYGISTPDSSNHMTSITRGYGSDNSMILLVLASGLIILFQAYYKLKNFREDTGSELQGTPELPSPAHY